MSKGVNIKNNIIGTSVQRYDAYAKVTAKANYTEDIPTKTKLHAAILRAKIAHGYVKNIDYSEALKVSGVLKVLTPDDLPDHKFPTAGHPYSIDPKFRDKYDRNILTKHVRLYGDEIAAVVATSKLAAQIALRKIKVEYEELPFYLDAKDAIKDGAKQIHEGVENNILAHTKNVTGNLEEGFANSDFIFEENFEVPIQQHCHMELQVCYAYQDSDQRWVVVSSTQIPHILRRILGEAFNLPWSDFRVIKPCIGGGFGNKQEVIIEPLAVALSMAMDGKPVQIALSREESIAYTRTRHSMKYHAKMGISKDGFIKALEVNVLSNKGAYASHTHAVGIKGGGMLLALYDIKNFSYEIKTVYTNIATAGAMRGYGVPQVMFFIESFMENIARKMKFNSFEFRKKNLAKNYVENAFNKVTQHSNKLDECMDLGKKEFLYEKKLKDARNFNHESKKRGVGMANFAYTTGVYPKGLEIAGARVILNQDGRVKLMIGASEIGQGSDTIFAQMLAQSLGISYEEVIVDANIDTDTAPFDTGAYASRQSFVTGAAVKKAALKMKKKILKFACKLKDVKLKDIDLINSNIVYKKTKTIIMSLKELAIYSMYDWQKASALVAESSFNCHENPYSYGCSFAEVEVDLITGRVEILSILNIHDSGVVLNPLLASSQVDGGMGMAIPYVLSEELKYDEKTGKPLNNNLLDYKMPTALDLPDLQCLFVKNFDKNSPYGNKSLGEPPMCSPAPAIRNAIYDALNIAFNKIPITPIRVFEALKKEI